MKVKDITVPAGEDIILILTKDSKCVSYDLRNSHRSFQECEVRKMKIAEDPSAVWVWAEIGEMPNDYIVG